MFWCSIGVTDDEQKVIISSCGFFNVRQAL
jgi:hypothetical protein